MTSKDCLSRRYPQFSWFVTPELLGSFLAMRMSNGDVFCLSVYLQLILDTRLFHLIGMAPLGRRHFLDTHRRLRKVQLKQVHMEQRVTLGYMAQAPGE